MIHPNILHFIPINIEDQQSPNRGRSSTKRALQIHPAKLAPNSDGSENKEIQELRDIIANLTQQLSEKRVDHEEPIIMESRMANNRSNRSLLPVLIREKKRELPPMSIHYKKILVTTGDL
ncbi:unnamed protein product [Rhizophagus irregularis]|nr:unnamed protein product [Rhizophagus irregularis]